MVGCENCCKEHILTTRFTKRKREVSFQKWWPFIKVRMYTVLWCRACYFGDDERRRGMHCDSE